MQTVEFIKFFLVVSVVVAQERSVCEQLASGCTCSDGNKNVVCSSLSGASSFPRPLPAEVVNLTVSDSSLGDISKALTNFQNYTNLKNILIKSSSIRYVQSCAISNLDGLQSVVLDHVTINKIATNAFSHLKNINNLALRNSVVSEFLKFAFHDISNSDSFRLQNLTIDKLETSSLRDLQNITTVELTNSKIGVAAHVVLRNLSSINVVRIANNSINSTVCGLENITLSERANTVGKIEFTGNNLQCFQNLRRLLTLSETGRWTMRDNTCNAPDSARGRTVQRLFTSGTAGNTLPVCPETRALQDDNSCRNYKIDQGILPPDVVPYNDEKDDENGASFLSMSEVCIFSAVCLWLNFVY